MRMIFVNHAHPDIPHVSGMRLGYFARAMARRGHEVVLLTRSLPGKDAASVDDGLSRKLADHDWATPLVVAVPPIRRRALELIRVGAVAPAMRKALTLWQLVVHGGVFNDWVAAAREPARLLCERFAPQVVWGTFGNTSNLVLAQSVARTSGCPWVIDIKDNWAGYLKPGLREFMAWRFGDASGLTSNCSHYQGIASQWLRNEPRRVVYSGVADEFLAPGKMREGEADEELLLMGSTRDEAHLRLFISALKTWLDTLPDRQRKRFVLAYAGGDGKAVSAAVREANLECRTDIQSYLPIPELAERCQRAFANCYIWMPSGFHHKLLELLACGRPVVSFPGETREALDLASRVETPFSPCTSAQQLQLAFASAWRDRGRQAAVGQGEPWRWSALSVDLESFLADAVKRGAR